MRFLLSFLLFAVTLNADVLQLYYGNRFDKGVMEQCERVESLFNRLFSDRGLPAPFNSMNVGIRIAPIDGLNNVLAQSSGGTWRQNNLGLFVVDGGTSITLDKDDYESWSDAILTQIIAHELFHFFGFSQEIWDANGLLFASDEYDGPALTMFQFEGHSGATHIPVLDSHFDQSLAPWLMTPSLSGSYIARTTLEIVVDNGTTLSEWGEQWQGGTLADLLALNEEGD